MEKGQPRGFLERRWERQLGALLPCYGRCWHSRSPSCREFRDPIPWWCSPLHPGARRAEASEAPRAWAQPSAGEEQSTFLPWRAGPTSFLWLEVLRVGTGHIWSHLLPRVECSDQDAGFPFSLSSRGQNSTCILFCSPCRGPEACITLLSLQKLVWDLGQPWSGEAFSADYVVMHSKWARDFLKSQMFCSPWLLLQILSRNFYPHQANL